MTRDNTKRRIPKILADELNEALRVVEKLGEDCVTDLLGKFRRNRVRCIATWGVNNTGKAVSDLEKIPIEHFHAIENLDKAFAKLHRYRNGGAGEYVASGVEKTINSWRGRSQKPNKYSDITDFLVRRKYESSDDQEGIRFDAMRHFDVSESTIYRALRKTKKKENSSLSQTDSDNSMQ